LAAGLAGGWTGHSERCTMPSVLAALGVAKGDRDPLGRWCPEGSDEYVRTYRVLVSNLAERYRTAVIDPEMWKRIDDEDSLEEAAIFAGGREGAVPPERRAALVRCIELTKAFYSCPDFKVAAARSGQDRETDGAWEDLADQVSGGLDSRTQAPPAPREELHGGRDSEDETPPPYLIVMSKRGQVLRLHKGDGCYAARHRRFTSYDVCSTVPDAKLYTSYCRSCWPRLGPAQDGASGSSTGSSSSDAAEEPDMQELQDHVEHLSD